MPNLAAGGAITLLFNASRSRDGAEPLLWRYVTKESQGLTSAPATPIPLINPVF